MFQLVIQWLLSTVCFVVVSQIVPGFYVSGLWPAMIAALAIGFINAILGLGLRVISFPLALVSFGLFLLFINTMMISMASRFVDGFYVSGMWPAFWGAVVLAVLGLAIRGIMTK